MAGSLHGWPSLSQWRIVADLLQATVDKIVIEIMNVQKQLEGSDCGLFAPSLLLYYTRPETSITAASPGTAS